MKVLVVVDLQTDFTFGALGNAECAGVVERLLNSSLKKITIK